MTATSSQMKAIDAMTINDWHIPGILLMEHAAIAVMEQIRQLHPKEVWIMCGSGNNGGDGYAIARLALLEGYKVKVYRLGNQANLSKDASAMMHAASGLQIPITEILEQGDIPKLTNTPSGLVLVDAIFGIGCSRNLEGHYYNVVLWMNQLQVPIVGVDLPSGINTETGEAMGIAVACTVTVTFTLPKLGLFIKEGQHCAGRVVVADIGIPHQVIEQFDLKQEVIEGSVLSLLPVRPMDAHKMTFGRVLIIAGSHEMCGAGLMATLAAYRTGCGLVDVLTHSDGRSSLQNNLPEAIVHVYDEPSSALSVLDHLDRYSSILIGPGLGQSDVSKDLLVTVLKKGHCPLVIDADGLNLLPNYLDLLAAYNHEVVITPHIGEMSRLTGHLAAEILENPIVFAEAYSKAHQVHTVLKSHRTIVTSPNDHLALNLLGNPGMATAGSGDVLAGIIVALLGQGLDGYKSATLGVGLHSLAGDHAKEKVGERSLIATDIIDALIQLLK